MVIEQYRFIKPTKINHDFKPEFEKGFFFGWYLALTIITIILILL